MRPWVWLGLTDAQRRWQRLVTLNPRSALGGEQAPRLTAVQEGATRTRSRIRIPVTRIPKQAGSCVRNAGSSGPPFHLADSLFQLVPSWGPSVDPDRGNSPSCRQSDKNTLRRRRLLCTGFQRQPRALVPRHPQKRGRNLSHVTLSRSGKNPKALTASFNTLTGATQRPGWNGILFSPDSLLLGTVKWLRGT